MMAVLVPMTDRARHVLELAAEFARESEGHAVKAEHLLFGLVAEREGLAAKLLDSLDIDPEAVRSAIQRVDEAHPAESAASDSIEQLQVWAQEELAPLGHSYVGTEHLMLSMTRVAGGRALAVLEELGLVRNQVREEVYSMLGHFA